MAKHDRIDHMNSHRDVARAKGSTGGKNHAVIRKTSDYGPPEDSENLVLVELAAQINAAHDAVTSALVSSVEHAIIAGEALLLAKSKVSHGGWAHWVRTHTSVSDRTARGYMQLAKLDPAKRRLVADSDHGLRAALSSVAQKLAPPTNALVPESTTAGPRAPVDRHADVVVGQLAEVAHPGDVNANDLRDAIDRRFGDRDAETVSAPLAMVEENGTAEVVTEAERDAPESASAEEQAAATDRRAEHTIVNGEPLAAPVEPTAADPSTPPVQARLDVLEKVVEIAGRRGGPLAKVHALLSKTQARGATAAEETAAITKAQELLAQHAGNGLDYKPQPVRLRDNATIKLAHDLEGLVNSSESGNSADDLAEFAETLIRDASKNANVLNAISFVILKFDREIADREAGVTALKICARRRDPGNV